MPAVIGSRQQRIFITYSVLSFHVVVYLRERPWHLVVIVPICHDRDKGLGRLVVGKIIAASHPELGGIVSVGGSPVGFAKVLRGIIYLPVPAIARQAHEQLLRVHGLHRIIIDTLQPAPGRYRAGRTTGPRHPVRHNGSCVAICVEVGVYAPVLPADAALYSGHARQADIDEFSRVIGFDRLVNIPKQGVCRRPVFIPAAALQININSGAPRVFFHDTDNLGQKGILRPAGIVAQGRKNAGCPVVHNGKEPVDMRPAVDISHHGGNAGAGFGYGPGGIHFKGENPHGIQPVAIIPQGLIHPAVSHEAPHHAPLAFQIITHRYSLLKNGSKKAPVSRRLNSIKLFFSFFCRLNNFCKSILYYGIR